MRKLIISGAVLIAGAAAGPVMAQDTVLNVVTAGSENMVDYVTDYLGPMFEETHPGVRVNVVGTGPGDAGSQAIFEKLSAQASAGVEAWDVDVAVVHQKMGGAMVREGLLSSYRDDIETGTLVTSAAAGQRAGHRRDRLCDPDVPQPDGHRLQPAADHRPARLLCRSGGVDKRPSGTVRL